MPSDLQHELQQTRPFASLEHEAQLSIVRTSSMLIDAFDRMLRPFGLTSTQFNVLRILRGADPEGLCRNEVRDRMLTRMPDVTRLLDRLETADLIARERSADDRRMVRTRITRKGLALLNRLEPHVRTEQERPFADLDESSVRGLVLTLAAVRKRI